MWVASVTVIGMIVTYLLCAWNPAITFSRHFYGKDVRDYGSGNAGYANFKRVFGDRYAWWVLALDLLKPVLVLALFSTLAFLLGGSFRETASMLGCAAIIGHSFPVWYRFKGGKGVLVFLSCLWFSDWRAAGIATVLVLILTPLLNCMSLTMLSSILGGLLFQLLFATASPLVRILTSAEVLLVFIRHRGNIVRLFRGEEPKFYLLDRFKRK